MWWNVAVGTSLLLSGVSTFVANTVGVVKSVTDNDKTVCNHSSSGSNGSYFGNKTFHNNYDMVRISKYPSRTTIGFF